MFRSKIKKILVDISNYTDKHPVIFPFVLLLFALTTYGLLITTLGFYWDDWPPILLSHLPDKSMIWKYFVFDRPFQSWTYYLLFPLCQDSAFLWQLSAILARWTASLTLFYSFLHVFPRQKNLLQWAAVLFVVFPGFADQSASVSFGSHFMVYTVFGLSLLFMVLAIKTPRRFWVYFPLSLVLTAAHLLSMEYFTGLELIRPILVFWLHTDAGYKKSKRYLKTALYWLPYLVVLGLYIYWRMEIYPKQMVVPAGSNYPYLLVNFIKAPVDTLVAFIQTIYGDLRFLLLDIWTDRILPVAIEVKSVTFWGSLFIGLGATYIFHLFFREDQSPEGLILKRKEIFRNIGLSFVIILFGLFPVWSTLRQISKGKWSDRFDIPVIFGVAILLLTIIYIIFKNVKTRNLLLIVLTGLSISYQIQTSNDYRKDFNRQKAFYSQLAWRIPSLEPGTVIFSPGIPSGKEADYSYSMGINMLFSQGEIRPDLDYWFTGPRYYNPSELVADPAAEIKDGLRIFNFSGVASKVVSVYMPDDGCLWVMDPYYAMTPEKINQLPSYGDLTNQEQIGETVMLTNSLSQIIDTGAQNTWCYYFEKGDLAQSKGNYEAAVDFYEKAVSENLIPYDAMELMPFVKAYAKLGRVNEAVALTTQSFNLSDRSKPSICQVWHDILTENPSILRSSVDSVYNSENCIMLEP